MNTPSSLLHLNHMNYYMTYTQLYNESDPLKAPPHLLSPAFDWLT